MGRARTVAHEPGNDGAADRLRADREIAREVARRVKPVQRLGFARAFTGALVSAYWSALTKLPIHESPDACPLGDLHDSAAALAERMGKTAARLGVVEASYLVGTVYTVALPDEYRSENGVFYTPPSITARLVDLATEAGVDWRSCKVVDPACGGGAFLSPVALRIVRELADCKPGEIIDALTDRVRGFEIDPFSAWMSQVFLEASVADQCARARRRLPRLIEVRDSLHSMEWDSFDLVIGNPPYGRIGLSPEMRERYKRGLYGHANSYGVFTDLALRMVRPGGVVAYVTPTSFLGGEYFKSLRGLIAKEAAPVAIDFVGARKGVFADVLQETALTTFRRDGKARALRAGLLEAQEQGAEKVVKLGRFHLPEQPSTPWILPRTKSQARLVARLAEMEARLADYGYKVSTGPLVWNRHKDQLVETRRRGAVPVVWAEAISPQGSFRYQTLRRNHAPWFIPEDEDEWLMVRSPCVLIQRTTAKEQARRLIAAEMPRAFVEQHGAVTVENHVNMVRPVNGKTLVHPAVIVALLNSAIVDQAFRCLSGSVAVSATEIEALPLPPADDLAELEGLVRKGSAARLASAIERLFVG
jgi:adenine-specific DNA-methyltransferase